LRYAYLVVEGPQDVAFIGRLLRIDGLRKIQQIQQLDPFWRPVIPRTFPPDGDLLKRVPVPAFFQSNTHSVAVHSAGGVSRLVDTVEETRAALGAQRDDVTSIGVFLDADWNVAARARFSQIKAQLLRIGLPTAEEPGVVHDGGLRTGVFIFPDNRSSGTLENLLEACAAAVYPELRDTARQFTAAAAMLSLTEEDRREYSMPSGEIKVVVSSIATFLNPTKAIQNSIEDNRWLSGDALKLESIGKLRGFLEGLLAL